MAEKTVGAAAAPVRMSSTVTVIGASSVGTVFEWYDFFLYGSLAGFITKNFFSGVNETTGYIFALLAFAAGFAVRPLGALVFGRLGDLWGRKNTFLITMLLMGLSTFVVGCLPSYAQIGIASPVLLIVSRLVQGLALGGEYGGAATYVAEHAPANRRGFYTSFIQITATGGLLTSLLVIMLTRGQHRGPAGRRRVQQPRDRREPLRHHQDRRDPPRRRVPQAHGARPGTVAGRARGGRGNLRVGTLTPATARRTDDVSMLTLENITDADRAEALFASWIPAGRAVPPDILDAVIATTLRTHGGVEGCACEVAAAYGENPSYAAGRMRWALHLLHRGRS